MAMGFVCVAGVGWGEESEGTRWLRGPRECAKSVGKLAGGRVELAGRIAGRMRRG